MTMAGIPKLLLWHNIQMEIAYFLFATLHNKHFRGCGIIGLISCTGLPCSHLMIQQRDYNEMQLSKDSFQREQITYMYPVDFNFNARTDIVKKLI